MEAGIGVRLIKQKLVVSKAMIKLEIRIVREVYKKKFVIEKYIIPVKIELIISIRVEFIEIDIL